MSGGISSKVQQFIFEYIDSIEQLDVLLLLRAEPEREWTAELVGKELRTSPLSASNRLAGLKAIGLVEECGATGGFCYRPATPELAKTVDELAEVHAVRRHQVYELIFSTLKRARKFVNAFTVVDPKKDGKG